MSVFDKLWKRPGAAPTDTTLAPAPEERGIPPLRKPSPFRNKGKVFGLVAVVAGIAGFILWHQWQQQAEAAEQAKAEAEKAAKKQASASPADFKWSEVDKFLSKPKPKAEAAPAAEPASAPAIRVSTSGTSSNQGKREKSPEELWRERRLKNVVLAQAGTDTSAERAAQLSARAAAPGGAPSAAPFGGPQGGPDDLGDRLRPTATAEASAQVLPDRDFLIAKGTMADCVMETRLVSTVSGMVRCVQSRDLYSDNGKVLLVERGTTWTGQYRGVDMKPGQRRLFVLWERLKTPTGVIITPNSPATDPLGGGGLEGEIDTHFWERFGAAILISLIDDFAAAAVQERQVKGDNNTVVAFPNTQAAGQRMAEKALESTVNIPPTLYKHHGDPIGIFVARDLDFSKVYGLRLRQDWQ